jgi:hypothetical protein
MPDMDSEVIFPNNVIIPMDKSGDATVDLGSISFLTFDEVTQAFFAVSRASLCIRIPSAEVAFGIELGYSRLRRTAETIAHDLIWIDHPDSEPREAGIAIEVERPTVTRQVEARDLVQNATRHGPLSVRDVRMSESDVVEYCSVDLRVAKAAHLSEIAYHCQLIIALLQGAREIADSPINVYRQLSRGNFRALENEAESSWFEAKSQLYGLSDPNQRFELALDVAALANLNTGGILVIGIRTTRDDYGRDRVESTRGVSRLQISVPQIEQILKHRIYPTITNLTISVFANRDREILAVLIPPQPPEKHPFLVEGVSIDGERLRSTGFTWVERQGASRQAISVAEVHGLISKPQSRPEAD